MILQVSIGCATNRGKMNANGRVLAKRDNVARTAVSASKTRGRRHRNSNTDRAEKKETGSACKHRFDLLCGYRSHILRAASSSPPVPLALPIRSTRNPPNERPLDTSSEIDDFREIAETLSSQTRLICESTRSGVAQHRARFSVEFWKRSLLDGDASERSRNNMSRSIRP